MPKGSVGTEPGVWRTEVGMTAMCLDAHQYTPDEEIEYGERLGVTYVIDARPLPPSPVS